MKIEVLRHASIKLNGSKIIYIDPFNIKDKINDADYIFITHDHYDHFDLESINNIINDSTKIIVPPCLTDRTNNLNNVFIVKPNNKYNLDNLEFEVIPAYNINKEFHPKEKEYVGYNILFDDTKLYIMGDTDITKESKLVKTDICFPPIGGLYTMNYKEAANYINYINPKKTIPIHYGSIVGDKNLGLKFKELIKKEINVELHL